MSDCAFCGIAVKLLYVAMSLAGSRFRAVCFVCAVVNALVALIKLLLLRVVCCVCLSVLFVCLLAGWQFVSCLLLSV